jgi:hypothetical protein
MTKSYKKPRANIYTQRICEYGLGFLGISTEEPQARELFNGFLKAYPICGWFENSKGEKQPYRLYDKKLLVNSIRKYFEDEEVYKYLLETLTFFRKMVYVATVGTISDQDALGAWLVKNWPQWKFERTFWRGPGSTRGGKNPNYYWSNNKDLTEKERDYLPIFGVFRASLIENVGDSLSVRPEYYFPYVVRKGRKVLSIRKWSNGEHYFAACPNCKIIFEKVAYDGAFCSRECATYARRKGIKVKTFVET